MVTGTFTQNSLFKKIPKPLIKSYRKGLKNLNLAYNNVVVVKCTGAIFVCKWIKSIG